MHKSVEDCLSQCEYLQRLLRERAQTLLGRFSGHGEAVPNKKRTILIVNKMIKRDKEINYGHYRLRWNMIMKSERDHQM